MYLLPLQWNTSKYDEAINDESQVHLYHLYIDAMLNKGLYKLGLR